MSHEDVLRDLRETAEKVNHAVTEGQRLLADTNLVKLDERTMRFLAANVSNLLGTVGIVVDQMLKITEGNVESFVELNSRTHDLGVALGFEEE